MLNRKNSILAAAVLAAAPLAAQAVVINFQFDLNDIQVSATAAGTYVAPSAFTGASLVGTGLAPVLTVPVGTYIRYGMDADVIGDVTTFAGPKTLGIAAYGLGMNNSTGSATSVAMILPAPTTINPFFSSVQAVGTSDGAGGINASLGTTGSYIAGGTTSSAKAAYGAGTFAELYSTQRVKPLATASATVNLSLTVYTPGLQYIVAGTNGSSTTYSNKTFVAGTDTLGPLPTLSIIYGTPVVTTISTPTHQAIISLTSGSTPVSSYGPADGTLTLGPGHGSYVVAVANPFTTAAIGSVAVTGFNPSTDTEIYALKLASGGVPLTAAQDAVVVADINGTNGLTNASSGVTASLVPATGPLATDFAGYSILLTAPGIPNPAELGFDFTSDAETDPGAPANITVTGVAAVPEPATAAGIVFGAAGLLLGRRKNKAILA